MVTEGLMLTATTRGVPPVRTTPVVSPEPAPEFTEALTLC